MNIYKFMIVILAISMLAGCGSIQPTTQAPAAKSTATAKPPQQVSPTTIPSPSPALNELKGEEAIMTLTPASGMQNLVETAVKDLAQRLSISDSQIKVVETSEVVWPDASLGCPQPGMLYKQVPQDGALIILEAEGTTYEYHTGGSSKVFLCETPPPAKTEKPPQIDITKLTPQSPAGKIATPPMPDNSIPPGEDQ